MKTTIQSNTIYKRWYVISCADQRVKTHCASLQAALDVADECARTSDTTYIVAESVLAYRRKRPEVELIAITDCDPKVVRDQVDEED